MTTPELPMSSRRFVAELKPDPNLRKIVLLAGCAALLIGVALLFRLPTSGLIRLALLSLWLVVGIWEISRFSRGGKRVKFIRLTAGEAMVVNRLGRQETAKIMSGSVVLPRFAWLRLRFSDGLIFAELLRGNPATCQHWRHLQILWRQGPGSFGGAPEADTISTPKTGSHF